MTSLLDLDKQSFEFPCPQCDFFNEAYLGQVKLRDVIICRGCKTNIQLDDHLNEYRKAERRIRRTLNNFHRNFKNITIRI